MLRARTTSSSHKAPSSSAAVAQAQNTPATPPTKRRLGFSGVANIFIRLRRLENRASASASASASSLPLAVPTTVNGTGTLAQTASLAHIPSATPSSVISGSPSRFRSPKRPTSPNKHHLVSSSGTPVTHPGIAEAIPEDINPVPVEYVENYECVGGVNAGTLVRATRIALMESVGRLGANALLDEEWECTICGPKHGGTYRVRIRYSASATRSSKPDPRRPVALDQVKGIAGLMTITRRNDI